MKETKPGIHFEPRWKEELVATSKDGVLIFEMTFGVYHVYFPTAERWALLVPAWAQSQWSVFRDACSQWCTQNRIPMSIEDNAYVYELKEK